MAVCGGIKMQQQKIRCAILGLGNQSLEHLQASIDHPDIEIIIGIDANSERWELTRQKFSSLTLNFLSSIQELKESNIQIDALILALPHDVYEKIWDDLIQYGKPLLKEKPLGRDYQEAKHFMQTAQEHHCALQTAIQRRQHPSYQFLADYLIQNKLYVSEVHAHLHLGKGQQNSQQHVDLGWRGQRQTAGGGALLDAGYHLIDLVQYLIGDFEVISSTMWNGSIADNGQDIEDRCWLTGCSSETWIMLDTWVKGEPNEQGGYLKSENIQLKTAHGILLASREGVWLDRQVLFQTNCEWQQAMEKQLSDFAKNIRSNSWQDDIIWDQLPAMRKIEEAYRLSSRY